MKKKIIKKEGYNLHLIKTTNFKTIVVKTVFWQELKEEEKTIRNMLMNNLLFSCENYKTQKEMSIKKEELYGTNVLGGNYRKGNYIFSEINFSVIDEKYSEKGLLNKALEFYFGIIQRPNIINNEFDKESFKITKEELISEIKRIKEDSSYYSIIEYKKLLGNKKLYTSLEKINEEIEQITEKKLYEYYQKFIDENNIDIFVIGDIDFKEIEKEIDKLFKIKQKTKRIEDTSNIYLTYEKEYTETEIKSKFKQSKLIMGGTLKNSDIQKNKYVSMIYNIIFGNSPNSKLFKNVREKHSYAYTVSSYFVKYDGMFIIDAGISSKNYEDTKKQILIELEEMKKGNFTNKDIKDAKQVIYGILKETNDYQSAIIDINFNNLYLQEDNITKQKEGIDKVAKQDIINFAKTIEIDTILLLKEQQNETN